MPNNKMERFTQRARRVLSLAQEEAERLRQNQNTGERLDGAAGGGAPNGDAELG